MPSVSCDTSKGNKEGLINIGLFVWNISVYTSHAYVDSEEKKKGIVNVYSKAFVHIAVVNYQ